MHKANGSASRSYTPSAYHVRGGKPMNPEARPLVRTKVCLRCNKGIYGPRTGNRKVHEECKTEFEKARDAKAAAWQKQFRLRNANPDRVKSKTGRKPTQALDAAIERPHPLLVVQKPLALAEVMHRYVASVLVECNGDLTACRRTLKISIHSLRRCIRRIEQGSLEGCNPIVESRGDNSRKTG